MGLTQVAGGTHCKAHCQRAIVLGQSGRMMLASGLTWDPLALHPYSKAGLLHAYQPGACTPG